MIVNGSEFRSEGEDYVYSLTLMGTPQQNLFVNCGEKPLMPIPSILSEILETNPDPKYNLSAKACQGILNRANRRGKKLPPILEQALIRQATPSKLGGGCERDSHGRKAGKGALVQTELSGTLGVSQDQTLIAIEGNGIRESHQGKGYAETDKMFTLNATQHHGVCYQKVTGTLTPGSRPGSYNGQDAYNDMLVVEPSSWDGTQVAPTLTARNAEGGAENARQRELQRSDRPDDGDYP